MRGRIMKTKNKLDCIYKNFKLMVYKSVFKELKDKNDSLTSSEFFCLECVYLLDNPTISEFAEFLDISSPNATYKVKQLIKKGYLKKEKDKKDGREYRLYPTEKFYKFYGDKANYGDLIMSNLEDSLEKDDVKKIDKVLDVIIKKVFNKPKKVKKKKLLKSKA